MTTNRGAKNSKQSAKRKAPLPGYYIITGRSETGLPKIISQTVPQNAERTTNKSSRSSNPSHPKRPYKIHKAKPNALTLLVALGYLILPTLTAIKLHPSVDWRYLVSGLILIWIITWHLYASDKISAKSNNWRIPENTLHFLELIGGWPAAYLAQKCLRHKTRKSSYQITFWTIGILHQALCLIYLYYPEALLNIMPIQ